MSVKAATHRGKAVWRVQVIRDDGLFNRRRFLDKRTHRRQDAERVEAAMIAEYEAKRRLRDAAGVPKPRRAAPPPAAALVVPDLAPGSSPHEGAAPCPTLAAFAEVYLRVQDPSRSDFRNKTRTLELHLLPRLGDLPLDRINARVIDELKVQLRTPIPAPEPARPARPRKDPPIGRRRRGGPRSPKTVNNILTVLRSVLRLALDYELLDRLPRFKMEKVPEADPVFLTEDEVARLLAALPEEWRLLVFMAVRTGMRRGELMALRWEDVHLEAEQPYVRVRRSVRIEAGGRIVEKEPKGGRARTIPITTDLVVALRHHCAGDRVFPGPNSGFFDHNRFRRVLSTAALQVALQKRIYPHLLRHTFASACYQRGIPPQFIQQWLGHAQIGTTERYAHLAPASGISLVDRLLEPLAENRGLEAPETHPTPHSWVSPVGVTLPRRRQDA